ncbi:MAG: YIP1 family protein [Pseudomonadota bacterium]
MQLFANPKSVLSSQKEKGIREEGNLVLIMLFAILNFFAQLPGQYRVFSNGPQTAIDSDGNVIPIDFAQFAGWQAVYSIFGVILVMYGLAAIAHLIARYFNGKATWPEARRAMFLAANVSLPLIALTALATWFGIPNLALILAVLTLLYFLWYWGQGLNYLEYGDV